jgi:hypothetical protein
MFTKNLKSSNKFVVGAISTIYSVETLTKIKFITWTYVIFVKNPETRRFLFVLAHILASIARNTTHYLFPEYFQSLRAKK